MGASDPFARQPVVEEGQVTEPIVFVLGVIVMIPVLIAVYQDLKS